MDHSLLTSVDAALAWVDLNENVSRDHAGLWTSKFPQPSRGDKIMGKREWEQRPHAAARILAAEVRGLRAQLSALNSAPQLARPRPAHE